MATEPHELEQARTRIRDAYSPRLLQAAGRRFVGLLHQHFQRIEASDGLVLNWETPEKNVALAMETLGDHCGGQEGMEQLAAGFEQRVRMMLERGLNLHDPRYIGHQVPAPVPLAGLFDAVGSVTNQVMAIYEMGPWATSVEHAVVERLGQMIGWAPGSFAGLATHGGSLANLTCLLTARNVTLGDCWQRGAAQQPPPALVVHADAHYSVVRAAGVLGLGTQNVVRAALDRQRRIDVDRLDQRLTKLRANGRRVVAVVACACATPIGAFDRLGPIADVCRRHKVWLHVDAAHGGAACFSSRHRSLLCGLDQADSLVWDAHKMLFVPALCAMVLYRNKAHRFETFQQDAPYLFDPSAPGMAQFDSGLVAVECTKRAAVYGLWGIWSLFGPQLFADLVDVTFDVARQFHQMLSDAPDFQPLHVPECNIVAFRYVPAELRSAPCDRIGQFQFDVRRDLIQSGDFYIVQTSLDGVGALRVTVCNPLTTADHMRALMDALRDHGRRILERSASRAVS